MSPRHKQDPVTTLFEMRVRVGGDPRHFSEFKLLCDELAKLSHPARPVLDWARVEQWCNALFHKNGADLQSTVALVLARSERYGVDGLVESMRLLEALVDQWTQLWPSQASLRMEVLDWLFAQLQPVLRGSGAIGMSTLSELQEQLVRLQDRLHTYAQPAPASLLALRQLVDTLGLRLQHTRPVMPARVPAGLMAEPVLPVVILAPPPVAPPMPRLLPDPPKRSAGKWLALLLGVLMVLAGSGWANWIYRTSQLPQAPGPITLESLMLFEAGSAELKPDAARQLVDALVNIKARPGWLIVISGHADNTGDTVKNLSLSRDRALAVKNWIQQMGTVAEGCFAIQSAADSQPVASNETGSGRAANRRVDIRLVPQQEACGV